MKIKVSDRVVFIHAARGSRKQIGTVIEITKDPEVTYTVRNYTTGHIYPCLRTKPGYTGIIIKKIS